MPEIKFCGLMRAADAAHAVALGVDHVGVILAPSPRQVTLASARALLAALGGGVRRVGVFASPTVEELRRAVEALDLAAVQVHGSLPAPADELRAVLGAAVWGVAGVATRMVDAGALTLARECDVLLLDTRMSGRTGGSGRPFDWEGARVAVDSLRTTTRIAVAGGLHPDNVAAAIRALTPDIVDVSSGIEASPGVKDADRMTAFVAAVRQANPT